ncbi:MAG: hypothetical protein AAGJ68_03860, partial [Pseudomonadota bacterium]
RLRHAPACRYNGENCGFKRFFHVSMRSIAMAVGAKDLSRLSPGLEAKMGKSDISLGEGPAGGCVAKHACILDNA